MAFSAAIHLNINIPSSSSLCDSKRSFLRLGWRQRKLVFSTFRERRCRSSKIIQSVLHGSKSNVNDNGASEPTKFLLERLFAQTQRLEEHVSGDPDSPQDVWLGLSLENLESDLQVALTALKKKEEDLQDAERTVLLERSQLYRAKEELEKREEDTAAAFHKHEKLEDELKQANLNLASEARKIEELKLQMMEEDQRIAGAESALALKEDELSRMRIHLVKKSEEAVKTESELKSKSQILDEVNEVVRRQGVELQMLQQALVEKEEELEVSLKLRKLEEEKLKVAETSLEKQTMEWLLAQEELKKLTEEALKKAGEANETMDEFKRVKKLLADVRSELVSSQKSLMSSRKKMEEQEALLEKQMTELEEQNKSIMAYTSSLKDAQIEVESEKVKLRVAEARNKELEHDLSMEQELTNGLQVQLQKEEAHLQEATEMSAFLQKELELKNTEFERSQSLLQAKASELVEANLEIQHLKSELVSLRILLEDKDLEILDAQKNLDKVNQEMVGLQMLMRSKEAQLIQASDMLKEKDVIVQTMQNELNDSKLKFSEAENMVERIVNLTNKMVVTMKDSNHYVSKLYFDPSNNLGQDFKKPTDNMRLQEKQLITELELTKESLRQKEMEILAAHRALTVKDEELKTVLDRLDTREKEFEKMKEEMNQEANDPRKLSALEQESLAESNFGDLAIIKLQLEAAQLEVEAATSALQKLADMCRELLNKPSSSPSLEVDIDTRSIQQDNFDTRFGILDNNQRFNEVRLEVSRLSSLTEQLVMEAGILNVD